MPQARFEPAVPASKPPPRLACMSVQGSAGVFIPVACTDFSEVSNRTNRAARIDVCQLMQHWPIV